MNEAQMFKNPENLPGNVINYQRQNTNLYILRTGLDTTEPYEDAAGVITIPVGGVFDFNGVLFKIVSEARLPKPDKNKAYWIAVTPDSAPATCSFDLVSRPGAYISAKKGCYLPDGRLTLKYVSLGDVDKPPSSGEMVNLTGKGRKAPFQLPKGWYYAVLASGAGEGHANGRIGGTASKRDTVYKAFFHNGGNLEVYIGGDGGKGGDGGTGGNGATGGTDNSSGGKGGDGGGGGSGAGEASEIIGVIKTKQVLAGNGANGGNGILGVGQYGYTGVGGGGGEGNKGGNPGTPDGFTFATAGTSVGYNGSWGGNGAGIEKDAGGLGANTIIGGSGNKGKDTTRIQLMQAWLAYGGSGGGGGRIGLDGKYMPDGSPGGSCVIYPLTT